MAQHKQIPMDPELKAKVVRVIEAYKNTTPPTTGDPNVDLLASGVPVAMGTIEEGIRQSDDEGKLSVSEQRALIAASILAARKLAQFDGGKRVPATMSAIADAVRR